MQINLENETSCRAENTSSPMQTADKAKARHQRQRVLTPRHRRILQELLIGLRTREEIDSIAGASNGPDEIQKLRRNFGLSIPCARKGSKDMDGHPVKVGIYSLNEADKTVAICLLHAGHVSSTA